MEGVIRTRVGYAGGEVPNPTYRKIEDHTETIQIEYDPEVITYEELIGVFWESHNPLASAWSRQYMSIVFVHNDEQEAVATETLKQIESEKGRKVQTVIRPYDTFYSAEDYHQKYYMQNRGEIFDAVREFYPSFDAFVDSTTAARINGYLAGHGSSEQFQREMDLIGLPEPVEEQLRRMAEAYW